MRKCYFTKNERAFEVIFNGENIERITEREPIRRLGDLKEYDEWDESAKRKVRMAFESFGI